MADVILNITLLDLNISWAIDRLLAVKPNIETKPKDGEVPDENGEYTPDQLEPAFATTKLWGEELLRRHMYLLLRKGHKILERQADEASKTRDEVIG